MKRINPILEDLIAPCGMNCAVCSRYLAFVNKMKRSQCTGCRPGNKDCKYLFKDCGGPKNRSGRNAGFCFECHKYPCRQIERMDRRYRANFQMSTKENLAFIKKHGVARFVETQYAKHHCRKCSGMISVHNGKCFTCDSITSLVEKRPEHR